MVAARDASCFWRFVGCDRVRSSIRPFGAAFQKPLAGMEISGSGPNLPCELSGSRGRAGFPDPDLFDHFPIQAIGFSHLPVPGLRFHGAA